MSAVAADAYASSLGHKPVGAWAFDSKVAACFPDMLKRSIPELDRMREVVFDIGSSFVQPGTEIVDLGCSCGDSVEPFLKRFGAECQYLLCDNSEAMLERVRARYEGWEKAQRMRILCHDLRQDVPACRPSLILSVLTLQFVPIERRMAVLRQCHDKLVAGGALIVVEKVLGRGSVIDDAFRRMYEQMKLRNGYTMEEVEAKKAALEHVMVPLVAEWNENMLRGAGFSQVDCFWRWLNFSGWVAVKS